MAQNPNPVSFKPTIAFPSSSRNSQIRDQLNTMFNPPRAHLYSAGALGTQFIATTSSPPAPVIVGFDGTRGHKWYDQSYDGSSLVDANRLGFTIQISGRYKTIINWSWPWSSSYASGGYFLWVGLHMDSSLLANGTSVSNTSGIIVAKATNTDANTTTYPTTLNLTYTAPLAAGTTLQVAVAGIGPTPGFNANFDQANGQDRCFFETRRVSS